jgi:hypothetical protein
MTSYTFDAGRRNDPVIRAKVEEIHKARVAMMLKAADELDALAAEMAPLTQGGDDNMYRQCYDAVRTARYRVRDNAEFMKGIGSETYIGNLAAGRLGEYVQGLASGD